jgi:dipeptidase
MSTRYNDGSHYENHQRAAELQDQAAHAHRSAAETHEKQDHPTGQEQSRHALELAQSAHHHNGQAPRTAVNEHGFAIFGHEEIAELRDRKESHQE